MYDKTIEILGLYISTQFKNGSDVKKYLMQEKLVKPAVPELVEPTWHMKSEYGNTVWRANEDRDSSRGALCVTCSLSYFTVQLQGEKSSRDQYQVKLAGKRPRLYWTTKYHQVTRVHQQ